MTRRPVQRPMLCTCTHARLCAKSLCWLVHVCLLVQSVSPDANYAMAHVAVRTTEAGHPFVRTYTARDNFSFIHIPKCAGASLIRGVVHSMLPRARMRLAPLSASAGTTQHQEVPAYVHFHPPSEQVKHGHAVAHVLPPMHVLPPRNQTMRACMHHGETSAHTRIEHACL